MKLAVAGSGSITKYKVLKQALDASPFDERKVASIHATDCSDFLQLAKRYAKDRKLKCKVYKVNIKDNGKLAHLMVNRAMAIKADCLLTVWDGRTHDVFNAVRECRNWRLPVFVYNTQTKAMQQ